MLIATITTLLLVFGAGTWGGMRGYVAQMDKAARKIEDTQRRDRARAEIRKLGKDYDGFEKVVVEHRKRILAVDSNYKSSAQDYRKVFLALDNEWEEAEREIIRRILSIRRNMTREEWEAMYVEMDRARERAGAKKKR